MTDVPSYSDPKVVRIAKLMHAHFVQLADYRSIEVPAWMRASWEELTQDQRDVLAGSLHEAGQTLIARDQRRLAVQVGQAIEQQQEQQKQGTRAERRRAKSKRAGPSSRRVR